LPLKQVLIIFPDEWISYSPSILNLSELLVEDGRFELTLLCFDSGHYTVNLNALNCHKIVISVSRYIMGVFSLFMLSDFIKTCLVRRVLRGRQFDDVIGVDFLGVKTAISLFGKGHLYSLEVEKNWYFQSKKFECVESVVIQSRHRYEYLQAVGKHEVFYIQNSPIYKSSNEKRLEGSGVTNLVCLGNLIPRHGIYECIEVLSAGEGITLTLVGRIPKNIRKTIESRYKNYLEKNLLKIDCGYIDQENIQNYLTQFDVGLCFYDFTSISGDQNFNYYSSPSGKVFNYFAAAIPVVGSKILGLSCVEEYSAGILLSDVNSNSIRSAVTRISSEYEKYSAQCSIAAKVFDYRRMSAPYIQYLYDRP